MDQKLEIKLNDIKQRCEDYYKDGKISQDIAEYIQFMTESNFDLLSGHLGRMQEIKTEISYQLSETMVEALSLEQKIHVIKSEIEELKSSGGKISDVEHKKSEIHRIKAEITEYKKNKTILKNRADILDGIIKVAITIMSNLKATKQL